MSVKVGPNDVAVWLFHADANRAHEWCKTNDINVRVNEVAGSGLGVGIIILKFDNQEDVLLFRLTWGNICTQIP